MIEIIAKYPAEALALFSFLLAGVSWGTAKLVRLAPSWLAGVMLTSGSMIRSVVAKVAQRWVDALKAGRADGKLTQDEINKAFSEAWDELVSLLRWKDLARAFGGRDKAEQWVKTEIEAAVNERKKAPILDPTKRSRSTE